MSKKIILDRLGIPTLEFDEDTQTVTALKDCRVHFDTACFMRNEEASARYCLEFVVEPISKSRIVFPKEPSILEQAEEIKKELGTDKEIFMSGGGTFRKQGHKTPGWIRRIWAFLIGRFR